jgi:hypothetical protein
MIADGVSIMTKTYVTFGLVVLALVEFLTAMHVFGRKGKKRWSKGMMLIHRIGGYIFLLYWIWPMVVGADLLTRMARQEAGWALHEFHGPKFFHAMLGVTVFILLLLKISFVRFYTQYRHSARLLGIVITIATIVTWMIAGWFFLCMMGSPVLE